MMSAEFAIQSAQATLKEAQDNLRRTTIVAPQDGTVTALTKEVGETVLGNQMMAGETIMKISQLGLMEVNVEVNESDIVRVALGDTATVEVDAYQDEVFKGVVTEIGNTALNSLNGMALSMDQVTNFSVKIRILAESYNHLCASDSTLCIPFRPGMSWSTGGAPPAQICVGRDRRLSTAESSDALLRCVARSKVAQSRPRDTRDTICARSTSLTRGQLTLVAKTPKM